MTSRSLDAAIQIELDITELSETVRDDAYGKDLPAELDETLRSLSCTTADAFLEPSSPEHETGTNTRANDTGSSWSWFGGSSTSGSSKSKAANETDSPDAAKKRIKKQVTRFLKVPDKYISWASVLLKSQAFHQIHPQSANSHNENDKNRTRPIIELPRTQYKKPYIPSTIKYDSFPEVNLYPISISHQFPFVGLARLVITQVSQPPQDRPLVGLDIVTFDDYNPKLYNSATAFVEVFRTSFSKWEWDCIVQHNNSSDTDDSALLPEFYLRWAIKEAYTKALGVGMGLPFDSFETHLMDVHADEGIYPWILERQSTQVEGHNNSSQRPFEARGSVILNPGSDNAKSEVCTFFFLPLWNPAGHGGSAVDSNMMGCACICLALPPAPPSSTCSTNSEPPSLATPRIPYQLTTKWQTLEDLIAWHKEGASKEIVA